MAAKKSSRSEKQIETEKNRVKLTKKVYLENKINFPTGMRFTFDFHKNIFFNHWAFSCWNVTGVPILLKCLLTTDMLVDAFLLVL